MSTKIFLNLLQKNTNAIRSYSYSSVITTNKENLTGVFPQLTTPFTRLRSEQVAWKELEDNLFRLNSSQPFGGYVVNGFYGENAHLNTKERVDIVKVVRKIVGKKKTIIVSHNSDSMKRAITTCELMEKVGADYFLLHTPCYYKMQMSYNSIFKFFTQVADKSPLPIIINNCPAITFMDFPAELCMDLADHPNIVGMKESSNNIVKISEICDEMKHRSNNDFSVLAGEAYNLLDALRVGAVGCTSALANVLGEHIIELVRLHCIDEMSDFNTESLYKAKVLQNRLIQPDLAIVEMHGVPGLKAALDANGYYGGPCRQPLNELSSSEVKKLKEIFDQNGFSWLTPEYRSLFL